MHKLIGNMSSTGTMNYTEKHNKLHLKNSAITQLHKWQAMSEITLAKYNEKEIANGIQRIAGLTCSAWGAPNKDGDQ